METLKKNWITYLGIAFLFTAVLYLLQYSFEAKLLTPPLRIALGFTIGISGLFSSLFLYLKSHKKTAEIIAGLGFGVLFATSSYASLSSDILWSAETFVIVISLLVSIACFYAYRYNFRILSFISILCGLMAPLIIKANIEQSNLLFIFAFIINLFSIALGHRKNWNEMIIMPFLASCVLFSSYYLLFSPENWQKPLLYSSVLFVVYHMTFALSYKNTNTIGQYAFLYVGTLNALVYVLWSVVLLKRFELGYVFTSLPLGILFILTAYAFHHFSKKSHIPVLFYFVLGITMVAAAGNDFASLYSNGGIQYVITTATWLTLLTFSYLLFHKQQQQRLKSFTLIPFSFLLMYWFVHAWQVEWVNWFGLPFIPFINPGALIWLCFLFFFYTVSQQYSTMSNIKNNDNKYISRFAGLTAHLVLVGLLTIQFKNAWDAYQIETFSLTLTHSILWMLYALVVLLWAIRTKDTLYRWISLGIVVLVSLKVFFLDLSTAPTIQKIIFLTIIGSITLIIAYYNNRLIANTTTSNNLPLKEEEHAQD